jgi:hypothetical protein
MNEERKICRECIGGDRPGPLLLRELTQKPRPSAADTAAPTPYAGPSALASETAVGGWHKVQSGEQPGMRHGSWNQQKRRPDVREVKDGTLGTSADRPEYCPPAFREAC